MSRLMSAFDTEVVAVRRLSPSLLRVTLADPCLAHLDTGGEQGPRDLRIKLMLPSPGHLLPDLSDLSDGWYQRWLALDPVRRGAMRTYTVRAGRPDLPVPEIDVDVVLHGGPGAAAACGPAGAWAAGAGVGDRLTLIGQDARSGHPTYGIEWRPPPPDGPLRVLLAGDETAAPAICSILESLPAEVTGHAFVEVPDPLDCQQVAHRSGVPLTWLARCGAPRGARLQAAVRATMQVRATVRAGAPAAVEELPEPDVDDELLWESAAPNGDFYAWVAGEAGVVRDLRRQLVGECGVQRSSVAFMGYWREGRAG